MILLGPSQLFLEAFINLKVMQLDYLLIDSILFYFFQNINLLLFTFNS